MRKNKSSLLLQTRVLHLENLEKREMLSVSPLDAAAAQETAAVVAESSVVVETIPVVLVESSEAETSGVRFEACEISGRFNATWDAVEGYETYHVKVSRDGGATWSTYRKGVEGTTVEIQGLYDGGDYAVRVYGENAKGSPVAATMVEASISPVGVTANLKAFNLGDTITANVKAGANASYTIDWYVVTSDGDVAIPEAAGQLEYTPTDGDATIKVVVTGDGSSAGTRGEAIIKSAALASSVRIAYDSVTHKGIASWTAVDNASKYRLQISRDGGETWVTYGSLTTGTTATVNGLYVGKSYVFRVTAYNEVNKPLTKKTSDFAPIGLSADTGVYGSGDTITVTLKGTENAEADVRWYYVTEEGDVEIEASASATSFAPESAEYPIKVVATGVNASLGSSAEVVVAVSEALNLGDFGAYNTSSRNVDVNWDVLDGAASYVVYKNTGAGWVKATKVVVENGEVVSGSATMSDDGARLTYRVNMVDVDATVGVRVIAYDESGTAIARESTSYAPFGVLLSTETFSVSGGDFVEAYGLGGSQNFEGAWYVDGALVAEGFSLTIDETLAATASAITFVATDVETGAASAATVYAKRYDAPEAISAEYEAESSVLALTFAAVEGASDLSAYQIQYYYDQAEYNVWLDLQFTSYVDNGDGTITVSRTTANSFNDREFRIRTIGESGASSWNLFGFEAPENFVVAGYDETASAQLLTWDAVDSATRYTLVATVNGEELAPITLDGSATSYLFAVDRALDCSFTLTATKDGGDSKSAYAVTERLALTLSDYDASTRIGVMSWDAIPGASSYRVLKSTNGGETWTTYATTTATEQSVRGLYLGKSYLFRVEALDAKKLTMATVREGELAAITLTGSASEYGDGDTLSVTLKGVAGVTADYAWYYVVDGGLVEISEASGLASYTIASAEYDVVVVATANQSDKATASVVFDAKRVEAPTDVAVSYDAEENAYAVTWSDQANETGYVVTTLVTLADGSEISLEDYLDANTTEYTIDNIVAGATYEVVVTATNAAGSESSDAVAFATALVSLSQDEIAVGDVLTASLSSDAAEATYAWSVLVDGEWVAINYIGDSLTITDDLGGRSIRVDAIGSGNSAGSTSYAVAAPVAPTTPTNAALAFDSETQTLTVSWDHVADATGYVVVVNGDETVLGKDALSMEIAAGTELVYGITVAAVNETDVSEAAELSFANVRVALSSSAVVFGDVIEAIVSPGDANVAYAWYSMVDGDWVALNCAESSLTITDDLAGRSVKVVVETVGYTLGASDSTSVSPAAPEATTAVVAYDNETKTAELSWEAIDDATEYGVEYYGVNDEETTSPVFLYFGRGETSTTIDLGDLYADYKVVFTVITMNEAGSADSAEVSFAAANVGLDAVEYYVGDTITASLNLAEAEAEYAWYYKEGGEWMELGVDGASLDVDATIAGRELKVVATGVGVSEGSVSEATILPTVPGMAENVALVYDEAAGALTVTWDAVDNAKEYEVVITTTDVEGNSETQSITIGSCDELEYVFDANADFRYEVSIDVVNDAATNVGEPETFVAATVSVTTDFSCGDTISASLSFEDATADYAWYFQNAEGEWVALEEQGASLLVTEELAGLNIRVDATGTGLSVGSTSTACASPAPAAAPELVFRSSYGSSADLAEESVGELGLMWNADSNATGYIVEFFYGDAWFIVSEQASTSFTAKFAGYGDQLFRVAGVNASGVGAYTEITIPIVEVTFDAERFVAGVPLTATLSVSGSPASVEWYAVDGATKTLIDGANSLTIVPPEVEALVIEVSLSDGSAYSYFAKWSIQGVPRETPSAVVTTADDVVDPFDGLISLREAVSYVTAGKTTTSVITFSDELGGATITPESAISIAAGQTIAIDGGSATTFDSSEAGALFAVTNGSLTVENADVVGGVSSAAIFSVAGSAASLNLTNVSVSGVQTTANGVVTAESGANLVVDRASFTNNSGAGSMIYVDGASSIVANSLFTGNLASTSGSLMIVNAKTGTSNNAYNLTVMNNTLSGSNGAGLYIKDSTNVYAYNMLITGNTRVGGTSMDYSVYGTTSQAYLYNFYFGSYSVEKVGTSRRYNEVRRGTLDDDYVPTVGSTYVDSGNVNHYGAYDLAGNARVSGAAVDIGAYELQQDSAAVVDEAFADLFDEIFED